MLNRSAVGLILLLAASGAAAHDDYAFCELTNKVASAGKLREYTNRQIENGLCMASKEAVNGMTKKDEYKERICVRATQYMMAEFKRRFPNRAARDVLGRC